jgi:hypothetical protein
VGGLLVSAALAVATVSTTSAQQQPAPAPGGMMGASGATARPGVIGGLGMMFETGGQPSRPIGSLDAAKQAFQGYIEQTGNQDLMLDEVMQFQWNYYAIVQEKSTGSKAFELLADPQTGAIFPEMGPHMMWNTKYSPMAAYGGGMMGGMGKMGGTTPAPATAVPLWPGETDSTNS